jgi:hypothetical protein
MVQRRIHLLISRSTTAVKVWKPLRGFLAAVIAAGGLVVAARDEALPQVVHAEMATTLAVPSHQVIPWQPWGSVPGAPRLAAGARITALYRDSSHLDLFVTDATGTVMSTSGRKVAGGRGFRFTLRRRRRPGLR